MEYYKPKKEEENMNGDTNFLDLKENKTYKLRILPPYDSSGVWYAYERKHFLKADGNYIVLPCKRDIKKSVCILCLFSEFVAYVKANLDKWKNEISLTDKELDDIIKDTRSSLKVLVNAIDRNDDNKLKLVRLPWSVFKQIRSYVNDPDWEDILHPDSGYDISITRAGKGFQTEYTLKVLPKPSSIGVELENSDLVNLERWVTAFAEKFTDEDYFDAISTAFPDLYEPFKNWLQKTNSKLQTNDKPIDDILEEDTNLPEDLDNPFDE